jgi:hypothetical protein
MARLSVSDIQLIKSRLRKLGIPVATFARYTGFSVYTVYRTDTFVSDECYERVRSLESDHAYALIKAWEIQQDERNSPDV